MKEKLLKNKLLAVLTGIGLMVALFLVGDFLADMFAGSGSRSRACEQLYTKTITLVEGVESVSVDCSLQFGGGWKRVKPTLTTSSQEEAAVIAENIVRAMAAEPQFPDLWSTPQSYRLTDGDYLSNNSVFFETFNGVPNVGEVRQYLNNH